MNLRCKKPRALIREERTYRDDRLFIIATEDTYAPKRYFDIFKNPRIKVHVLPTVEGFSSPEHVLQRLDKFAEEYDIIDEDQLWLMLDTDHWVEPNHIANFKEVCTQAIQKGFRLAHSNSCFEVWLLLHITDLDSQEQFRRCRDVKQRLEQARGDCNRQFSLEGAVIAVERAKKLDDPSDDRWPSKTGSHVYRVVEKLL